MKDTFEHMNIGPMNKAQFMLEMKLILLFYLPVVLSHEI